MATHYRTGAAVTDRFAQVFLVRSAASGSVVGGIGCAATGKALMDDQEALLHLYLGSPSEQEAALGFFFDRYYCKVVEVLAGKFRLDRHDAENGTADAFMELRRNAATESPKLEGIKDQPFLWLLDRARSRTIDESRRRQRMLRGAPKALQGQLARHAVEADDAPPSARETNPLGHAASAESLKFAKAAFFEFLETLEGVDRGILLHDMVWKYELLSQSEAAALDEELIGRSAADGIYTDEALQKRRQRMTSKLREFLDKRGIR